MPYRRDHLQEGNRLLTALRGGRLSVPATEAEGAGMLAAARFHGVTPTLLRAYDDGHAPELAALRTDVMGSRIRALMMRVAATDIAERLTEARIAHAFIKGPIVAQAYPDADRSFVDIDVLVDPATMLDAIAVLSQLGAEIVGSSGWPRNDGVGEVALSIPSGVAIDLHADLIHQARVRRNFDFPAGPLLDRAITVELLQKPVSTLAVEDHLVYITLHAMLSGGHRLVWFSDLDAMVRHSDLKWDVVIDRAREAKLALVVGVMLQRSCDLLGTPVPEQALSELTERGALWNGLLREMERRNRIAACHGPYRTGQFTFRATRNSSIMSAVALAEMAKREWLPTRVATLQARRTASGGLRPPRHPGGIR